MTACNRCGSEEVEWLENAGKYTLVDSATMERHQCKGVTNKKEKVTPPENPDTYELLRVLNRIEVVLKHIADRLDEESFTLR